MRLWRRISLSIAFFGVANLSQYLPTLPYDPVQMADFVQLSHTLGILGLVFVGLSTVLAVLSCCFFRRRSRLLYFGLVCRGGRACAGRSGHDAVPDAIDLKRAAPTNGTPNPNGPKSGRKLTKGRTTLGCVVRPF